MNLFKHFLDRSYATFPTLQSYEVEIGSTDRIMDYRELVLLSYSRNLESGSGSPSRTEETALTLLKTVRKAQSVYCI